MSQPETDGQADEGTSLHGRQGVHILQGVGPDGVDLGGARVTPPHSECFPSILCQVKRTGNGQFLPRCSVAL